MSRGLWCLVLTFAVAFFLTAIPFPDWAAHWRPTWVGMMVLYWALMYPQRMGVGSAWMAGLILDVQAGTLLGLHATGLALVAFVALGIHLRFRAYHLFQQTLVAGLILFVYLLLIYWGRMALGQATSPEFLGSALTSLVLWPWLFFILQDLQQRAGLV